MFSAVDYLQEVDATLKERGKEYDKETERSMDATVAAFHAVTGKYLTPAEGYLFMQLLKDVRQFSKDRFHQDSAIDCIAYAALKAEALNEQYNHTV